MELNQSSPPNLQVVVEYLKVLAEPNRLQIFNLLMEGVQCNCELGDKLQMAPNLISHHLRVLREAGLIDMERDPLDSRWVYYSINRSALDRFNQVLHVFLDPGRIQQKQAACGPRAPSLFALK